MLPELIRALEWGRTSEHHIKICSCTNCSDYRSLLNDIRATDNAPPPTAGIGSALAEVGLLLNTVAVIERGNHTEVVISAFVLGGITPTPSVVREVVRELAEWTADS